MDLLAHHDQHRSNVEHSAAEQLIARGLDGNGSSNQQQQHQQHQQDATVKLPLQNHRWLQQSWLLMLFVAPILVAMLVWLLVLLRRRARQSLGKLSPRANPSHRQQQHQHQTNQLKGSSQRQQHADSSGSAFLLDPSQATSSSSTSSSSSSASCGSSGSSAQSESQPDSEASRKRLEERVGQLERQQTQTSRLIRHTNHYLASLTYQEIVACAVAFTVAILNVVRMRNLFCCNLVIFVLITSRLLNLLTLATFALGKLVLLARLRPLTTSLPVFARLTHNEPQIRHQDMASRTNIDESQNQKPEGGYEDTTGTRTATICRLLVSGAKPKEDRKQAPKQRRPTTSGGSCCRLVGLGLASGSLGLVCLYLRLMGSQQLLPATTNTTNWIQYAATSTTTEASTRYSHQEEEQQQQQHQTSHHSGWASRLQPASSQLRHLIDQYELQAFLQLLLDLNLQTSRFACSLSSSGYGQSAKLAMGGLYLALMLLVLAVSLANSRLGSKRLRQLQRASLSATLGTAKAADWPEQPLVVGGTDSSRKRYSDLLKQSLRHHQSALDMALGSQHQHQHQHQEQRVMSHQRQRVLSPWQRAAAARPQLRYSSSMRSLLAPLPACSSTAQWRQQQQQQQQRHLRRLASELSVAQPSAKVPAGKLASSGGQLAWLPLGSAATVASLSNIGQQQQQQRPALQRRHCLRQQRRAQEVAAAVDEWKWEQEEAGARSRLAYLELRRDLRLSQALILFGQLLDHAPILLLLLAASFLPDNPTYLAGWTSGHDNAFVWLSLLQALGLPVLLLSLDRRLRSALRRSLSCSSSSGSSGVQPPQPPPPPPQLRHQRRAELVLGQSASHPDFMFACSPPARALTGPSYPARNERPLAVDTSGGGGQLVAGPHRHPHPHPHPQRRKRPAKEERTSSAFLRATSRLLRIGKAARRSSPRCSQRTSNRRREPNGQGERTNQNMSPTSSLSTLIRKFNHDNYTSVCQQYERRKHQLEEAGNEENESPLLIEDLAEESLLKAEDTTLTTTTTTVGRGDTLGDSQQEQQAILCRKGGLYYNYSLEDASSPKATAAAKINPMLGPTTSARLQHHRQESQSQQQKSAATKAPKSIEGAGKRTKSARNGPELLSAAVETQVMMESRGGQETSAKRNNEPIISNINSVQELLDRMNGMMLGRSTCKTTPDEVEIKEKQANQNNKSILAEMMIGNAACNDNHSRLQSNAAGSAQSQHHNQTTQNHPRAQVNGLRLSAAVAAAAATSAPGDTLDYSSLRSMDDALSLVSVSSEFEYHNINQAPQIGLDLHKSKPANVGALAGTEIATQKDPNANLLFLSSSSSSSSSSNNSIDNASKKLQDLRFPSFLPTKPVAGDPLPVTKPQKQAAKSHFSELVTPPRVSAANKGAKSGRSTQNSSSSSLLNLTAAKFAALTTTANGNSQAMTNMSNTSQRGQLLHLRAVGSTNTITKQKAPSTGETQRHPTENELSLPAGSGNVRARIRKMEQQSTPNLTTDSSQQQVGNNSNPKRPPTVMSSMIPVNASKLPVPTSGQLTSSSYKQVSNINPKTANPNQNREQQNHKRTGKGLATRHHH